MGAWTVTHSSHRALRSDGRCGLCSCWCRFCVSGAHCWRTGIVLIVARVVLPSLLPTPLSILAVHHMPHCVSVRVRPNLLHPSACRPGRTPPASSRCHVREPHVHRLCAWCTWALRAPAWFRRVSCAPPRVARAPLWLTRVSCALPWWHGWSLLPCARVVVLGSSQPGLVRGSFPFLTNLTFPKDASGP